jgi:hypothetical protein
MEKSSRGKKPVYNGYEERYVTGSELKVLFEDCYYSTGRHHSVVLGITIPEYLEFLNVSESLQYRIFINEHLCRIMDGETDRLISFFGYTKLENVKICKHPEITLPKICPECGLPMEFKNGRYGEFLGCSNYPNCKYTTKIWIIGNYINKF